VPDSRLTFEHALLLVNELARGELVALGHCRTCRGVVLRDRLSTRRLQCVFCSTGLRAELESVPGVAELGCERGDDRRTRFLSVPLQLSCLDECVGSNRGTGSDD
jgi:hypothetical protein